MIPPYKFFYFFTLNYQEEIALDHLIFNRPKVLQDIFLDKRICEIKLLS